MHRTTGSANWPRIVPVFAVSGALLLPGGRLPLTVFEPRYMAMVDDALGTGRWLAVVQPTTQPAQDGSVPGLYAVGTLGRITAFGESGDGRYLITVTGMARFRISGLAGMRMGYRRIAVEYQDFGQDQQPDSLTAIDRPRLMQAVSNYFTQRGLATDMSKLEQANDADFVSALAMAAPLRPEEKQALLEASTLTDRAHLMTALFEMAVLTDGQSVLLH